MDLAQDVFGDILEFLKNIQGKTPKEFDEHFGKDNARYTTIELSKISDLPEVKDVSLVIKDRATFGVRKKLKALSSRDRKSVV